MAWLRRIVRAARAQPGVTVAAVVVLLGSAVASAAVVMNASDDDNDASPPTTTTIASTTTTVAPTTTAAPATTTTTTTTTTTVAPTTTVDLGQRCLVRLHGKGNFGADTYAEDGVKVLTPDGNDEAWNGLQWLYFPNGRYNDARRIVADALDDEGCDSAIINGFSNGAAFAGKLYCKGETFDDRVIRYVIDDPVPDNAVKNCSPDDAVDVTLYWTGALDPPAEAGWDCREQDWTCEGGTTIGIDAYAAVLATDILPSKYSDHRWYQDAPELSNW